MNKCLPFLFSLLLYSSFTFAQRVYISEESLGRIRVGNVTPTGFNSLSPFITAVQPRYVAVAPGINMIFYQSTGNDLYAASLTTGAVVSTVLTTGSMDELYEMSYSENAGGLFIVNSPEVEGARFVPSDNDDSGNDYQLDLSPYEDGDYAGVAVDDGNEWVYLSDGSTGRILKTNFAGNVIEVLAQLDEPTHVAYDGLNHDLWVVNYDGADYQLYKIDMPSNALTAMYSFGTGYISDLKVYAGFGKVYYAVENTGIFAVNTDGNGGPVQQVSLPGAGSISFDFFPDNTAPGFTGLTPVSGSTNVSSSPTLQLTFNEAIKISNTAGTALETSIRVMRADNSVHQTIDRSSANISITGATVTITGINTLNLGEDAYVLIGPKVFADLSSNNFSGIASAGVWRFTVTGGVSVTIPNTAICEGAYTALPDIVITETQAANFKDGSSATLILSPTNPGYSFQAGTGTVGRTGPNLSAAAVTVTSTSVTITYTISGTSGLDVLTISGLMITSNAAANPSAQITRSGGTGLIEGLATNGIVAQLTTQAAPAAPSVTYPNGTVFCEGVAQSNLQAQATGTSLRWYNAADLLAASEITAIAGATSANGTQLSVSTATATTAQRWVTQTISGCRSAAFVVEFTISDNPDVSLTPNDNTSCDAPNGSVVATIDNQSGPLSDYTIVWHNGPDTGSPVNTSSTTLTLPGLAAGPYTISVSHNPTSCKAIETTPVGTSAAPPVVGTVSGDVCETTAGTGVAQVDLTTYNNDLTSGNPDLIVTWIDAGSNAITSASLSDGDIINYTVESTSTGCETSGNVTFNVSAQPSEAAAGVDMEVCGNSVTLAATAPVVGSGTWTIISGAGGAFSDNGSAVSNFNGTIGQTYSLRWTVANGPVCADKFDEVVVEMNAPPTTSAAGPDQSLCSGLVTLAANTPVSGTGQWSVVSGNGGSFSDQTSPSSGFTGTAGETYNLRWTITNSCGSTTDEVAIVLISPPSVANAGADQNVCGATVTLAANSPAVGAGQWSIISGSGGSFVNNAVHNTTFNGAVGSAYTLRWSVTNSPCPVSTDDVIINLQAPPTPANAGQDQTVCGTSVTLEANTPSTGTGSWSVVSGAGSVLANSSATNSTFSGVGGTTYTVRWTIANGACTASSDDVLISFVAPPTVAAAGDDQNVCGTITTLAANTPTSGTGQWAIVGGTGGSLGNASSATSSFTGTVGETYQLRWTTTNGICTPSGDEVIITFIQPPTTANAGTDLQRCGTIADLSANTPQSGTGTWSVVSGGGGVFSNTSNPISQFTGVAGTTYVLRWTISKTGCSPSSDEVTVELKSVPSGAGLFSSLAPICQGHEAPLSLTGIANADTYNWTIPGGIEAIGPVSGATVTLGAISGSGGLVSVTPINQCGPGVTASTTISVLSRPSVNIVLPESEYPGTPVEFRFDSDATAQSSSWSFSNGITLNDDSPEVSFESGGTYAVTLSVIASNGCEGTDTKNYTVLSEPDIDETAIKNVITANGDDRNNVLYIEHLDRYPDNEVRFLDRWGVEIFSRRNYQNDWEATGKDGNFLPAGQYICIVKLNENGKVISRTVSIIKGR